MKLIRKFKTVSLLGLVLILAFGIVGCGDDSTTTAVTNPNPNPLVPTGHIQGLLRDASTLEPVVNAVVDIGVARAVTSATGQFVLYNVPVTRTGDCDTCSTGYYNATIDMRNVVSPVKMNDPNATAKYGDFYFKTAMAYFSTLDDTNADNAGGGSGSNHDTPVTGLVANVDFKVGQMSATLTGVVAGCDEPGFEDDFFTPVGAGYTVLLTPYNDDGDTASGYDYNIAGSTVTDANGAFTFANIEAGQDWTVLAKSPDGTMRDSVHVDGIGHMMTETLSIKADTALHVCSSDVLGPTIIAVSPEPGSDLAPGTQEVIFTFNEPIRQTPATSTDPSGFDNLFDHLNVIFVGNKADLIAYSAAWNAAFTQLTVTFKTAASGKYAVRIRNIGDWFTDENLLPADRGVCPDDSVAAAALGLVPNAGDDDPAIYFTTNGGLDVAAPQIVIANAVSIDYNSTAVVLDWLPVSGAVEYYVWRTTTVDGVDGQAIFLDGTTSSLYLDDTVSFVDGELPVTYTYTVTAVNSDTVQSDESNEVVAADVNGPLITNYVISGVLALPADGESQTETITFTFSEPMDEAAVEALASWILAKTDNGTADDIIPVIDSVLQTTATEVQLTVTLENPEGGAETYSGFWYLGATSAVTDVAGNAVDQDADVWNNEALAIQ
ncbi:MAG: hypothetical protein R6X10_18910 [Desulfobacterales bacterium]